METIAGWPVTIILKSAVVVGALALASTQLVSNRQAVIAWLRPVASEISAQTPKVPMPTVESLLPKTRRGPMSRDIRVPNIGRQARAEPVAPAQISGVERILRDRHGSCYVDVYINGALIRGMIDMGTSMIALTDTDARRIGVAPQDKDYTVRMNTANGVSCTAPVELKAVRLGSITFKNIRASVAKLNALWTNLIGMSFLNRLKSFEFSENNLILRQ